MARYLYIFNAIGNQVQILALIYYIIFQAPFNTVLDINFRGRTSGSDITYVTIELGEIKLSSGSKAIKKAYRQLLLRLAVLGFVVKAMNINGVNVKCNLVGKIFVPRTSEVRIQPSWEDGITFSDSANCHVDIVTIGEKQQKYNQSKVSQAGRLVCSEH